MTLSNQMLHRPAVARWGRSADGPVRAPAPLNTVLHGRRTLSS
jgi:hypothetical protein